MRETLKLLLETVFLAETSPLMPLVGWENQVGAKREIIVQVYRVSGIYQCGVTFYLFIYLFKNKVLFSLFICLKNLFLK